MSDTQSNPGVAKGLAQKAVDDDVFAVIGPVFSGSIMVSMAETKTRRDPQLHRRRGGGHHAAGQPVHLPHQLHAGHRDAQGGALHREQPEGQDGGGDLRQQRLRQGRPRLDHQGARGAGRQGRRPTSPPTRARSTSPAPVLKAKQSNADALFVYTNEEESARALRELRKQGYDKPIVGETTLTGQKVIELAGDAANGAVAHVGLTVDAPQPAIKAFDAKFEKEYKYSADHNGIKGYTGVYMLKAGTEKVGKLDRKAVAKALHGAEASARPRMPGVLHGRELRRQRRPRPRELHRRGRRTASRSSRRRCRRWPRSKPRRVRGTRSRRARGHGDSDASVGGTHDRLLPAVRLGHWPPARSMRWRRWASRCCGRPRARSTSRRASSSCCRRS